jgi:hypothetical protein
MLRVIISSIAVVVTYGLATRGADATSCQPSEVWEISTRHLSCTLCALHEPPNFDVNRWHNGAWQKATIEQAIGPSHTVGLDPLTIIYVHGNWMERNNALERVRIVDGFIKRRTCEPYRLIMFSWPSQHEERFLREVRDNAICADVQSFYLAWLLQSLQSATSRVSLLGFSFGSRTTSGALHLEAGGQIYGRTALSNPLAASHVSAEPTIGFGAHRVSLVAPAMDRTWLAPSGQYSKAMNQVDRLVNLYNSKDPFLRRFRFVDSVNRPIAAGFMGLEAASNPPATSPLQGQDRIEQYDCRSAIGSTHNEVSYYSECSYFRVAIDNLLWK